MVDYQPRTRTGRVTERNIKMGKPGDIFGCPRKHSLEDAGLTNVVIAGINISYRDPEQLGFTIHVRGEPGDVAWQRLFDDPATREQCQLYDWEIDEAEQFDDGRGFVKRHISKTPAERRRHRIRDGRYAGRRVALTTAQRVARFQGARTDYV